MLGRLGAMLTLSAAVCTAATPFTTAAAVPSTLTVAASSTPVAAGVAGRTYVSLGDSYTSAPLVPPDAPGSPPLCGRSGANYPHLLAAQLHLDLTDVSCAGATSRHLKQARSSEIPPQIAALSPRTSLVTIGIGGNDHNLFASVFTGCGGTVPLVLVGSTSPCRDAFADRFAKDIADDAATIRADLREIHQAAPKARVLVVGYPSLFPHDAVTRAACLLGGIPFSAADIDFLDGVERSLNSMLAAAAAATKSEFVDTYTPSLGHDMCQLPGVRWIEPLFPLSPAAPVHPNAEGEAATARAVAGHLP